MRYVTRFAQATGVPNNGGSNAQDFQPPTRNPQNPAGTTQQTGGVQQPLGQDVLSNPNLRITVPVNPATKKEPVPQVTHAGIDWLPIIIVSVLLVVAAELFLRRREKRRNAGDPGTEAGESEKTFLAENQPDESTEQQVEEFMGPPEDRGTDSDTGTSDKKSKKKKSKRKKR
jgi:hypothetical protein